MNTASHATPGWSRRAFLQLAGAAGVTAALSSCAAGGPAPSGTAGAGDAKALSVLVEAGGKAELEPVAALFTKQTGTKVELVELPYDGLFNRLQTELTAGSVSFDVAALDAVWLPTFAGALAPLDALFTDAVKQDLFDSLVTGAKLGGSYVGMPVWTNAEILFYRKDLFEDPKEKAAFAKKHGYPLAPPTNWQQFQDVAAFFTRGTSLYGTDVKGAVETEWLAHVGQAGAKGLVLDPSGKVIIDSPEHLAALTFYSDLNNRLKVAPPGAAQVDWGGAQNLFNQGKTAMMRFWAHAFPLIPADSPIHGKVGAAPMIAGAAGVGGVPGPWYLSVPKSGQKNDLATSFVKFAYDNNALSIKSSLGLAARKSAFEQYAGQKGYEHFAALTTTLAGPATLARPATPKWQQIVDTVLVPMLQKSLVPGADYAALLSAAKGQVEPLVS